MAGDSESPDLPWTFQVADVPFVVVRTRNRHWLLEGNCSGEEDFCEWVLPLDQLPEYSSRAVGVNKRNQVAPGAEFWLIVDELEALIA